MKMWHIVNIKSPFARTRCNDPDKMVFSDKKDEHLTFLGNMAKESSNLPVTQAMHCIRRSEV